MLDRITARELSEWMAFERFAGPIGNQWTDEMQAQMHEILQAIAYLTGAQAKKNPVRKPVHVPRPWEMYGYVEEPEPEDEDEKRKAEAEALAKFEREAFGVSKDGG